MGKGDISKPLIKVLSAIVLGLGLVLFLPWSKLFEGSVLLAVLGIVAILAIVQCLFFAFESFSDLRSVIAKAGSKNKVEPYLDPVMSRKKRKWNLIQNSVNGFGGLCLTLFILFGAMGWERLTVLFFVLTFVMFGASSFVDKLYDKHFWKPYISHLGQKQAAASQSRASRPYGEKGSEQTSKKIIVPKPEKIMQAPVKTSPPPTTPKPIKPEPVFVPPPLPIPEPKKKAKASFDDDFFEALFKGKDPSKFHFIEHPHGEMAKQIMITLLPLFNIPCPGFKVSTRLTDDPSRNVVGCFSRPDIIIKASELDDGDYYSIVNLIKHELIHAWQAYYGFYDEGSWRYFQGHDAFFFIKALEVEVTLDNCLKLYSYCRPLYEEVTEGQLKGLTPEQAWDKLFPGKKRRVINGPWI